MPAMPNIKPANMPAQKSADRPSKRRTLRGVCGKSRLAKSSVTSANGMFIRNSQRQVETERIADAAVGPTEKATPTTNA